MSAACLHLALPAERNLIVLPAVWGTRVAHMLSDSRRWNRTTSHQELQCLLPNMSRGVQVYITHPNSQGRMWTGKPCMEAKATQFC